MANRYWVGGAGTWDASDTSHWSASSGQSSGASVPTSGDDVIFDGLSGSGVCTVVDGSSVCRSITTGATAMQFVPFAAGHAITIGGSGGASSITNGADANLFLRVQTVSASLTFSGNNTIGGLRLGGVDFTLTCGGTLTCNTSLAFDQGVSAVTILGAGTLKSTNAVTFNGTGAWELKSSSVGEQRTLDGNNNTNALYNLTSQDINYANGPWVVTGLFTDNGNNTGLTFPGDFLFGSDF